MLKTIDLFAGAGGLSYGFEATRRFHVVAAAEKNPYARETYRFNHQNKDIRMIEDVRRYNFKQLAEEIGGIDIVIGGPPCQGFSNANRQKNHIISMNNSLVKEYFRAVREIQPMAFVMENVSMLSSDTHRFYDSFVDHDEVVSLGVQMRKEELVIAEENYNGVNCYEAIRGKGDVCYRISDELLQLINVLYKNRRSKDRLPKYISKNSSLIKKKINQFFEGNVYEYEILHAISDKIDTDELKNIFEELGRFIKFQRSFRLREELDSNQIIYDLVQNPETKKITAILHSYSVIDYVNKILGNTYVKDSGEVNSLWFGVPQERKRFIMLGVRSDILKEGGVNVPLRKDYRFEKINVGQAILDLAGYDVTEDINDTEIRYHEDDDLSDYAIIMRKGSKGVKNHIVPKTRETAKKRFEALSEGENFHKLKADLKKNYADPKRTQNSIYLRLDSSQPSGTVVNVRKSMWVHPTIDRAISVREAARLQSFPDRFVFKGTKDSQYQQVGNAVPPLMAQGIARKVLYYLKNKIEIIEK